jgi:hypothetical protein
MAFIGILVLMGVVVNNGIVLVEHINSHRRGGAHRDPALIAGCRERLRPILMTMGTTILGMLPLCFGTTGIGGDGPPYYPMARGIAGGLAFSTVVTLLFLPTWYATLDDMFHWVGRVGGGMLFWAYREGGVDLAGKMALDWVLITSIGGALGCALAAGHPLSILVAAVVSPVTPFIPPTSGMFSALVEAWLRKPTYEDMLRLRDDTGHWRGWWRNRFARVFVNFMLTNFGTAMAVWVAGANFLHRVG